VKRLGCRNVPGIWSDAQVLAWKRVTERVHSKGGYIFLQLWALGRTADAAFLASKGHRVVSASTLPQQGGADPTPLTSTDIQRYVQTFAQAAKNAILKAEFDGVEIHDANGYLLDQFLQTVSNNRTDEYGGSVENRSRFPLMVVKAVTEAVGEDRVGIRFSPFGTFQGMGMQDPVPTFSYIIRELADRFPRLGYIHLVEPPAAPNGDREGSLDFARRIWNENESRVFLSAGGYDPKVAETLVREYGGAAVFGRWFISNPDLPFRIEKGIPLNPYDPKTFYTKGPQAVEGYTDYPFADDVASERSLL